MDNMQHKELAGGRWQQFSFFEQMANVGSEIERAIKWREKNAEYAQLAFERSLELLDLTIQDKKNSGRIGELLRVREAWSDHFFFDNEYKSTDQQWQKYFFAFNFAASLKR